MIFVKFVYVFCMSFACHMYNIYIYTHMHVCTVVDTSDSDSHSNKRMSHDTAIRPS